MVHEACGGLLWLCGLDERWWRWWRWWRVAAGVGAGALGPELEEELCLVWQEGGGGGVDWRTWEGGAQGGRWRGGGSARGRGGRGTEGGSQGEGVQLRRRGRGRRLTESIADPCTCSSVRRAGQMGMGWTTRLAPLHRSCNAWRPAK